MSFSLAVSLYKISQSDTLWLIVLRKQIFPHLSLRNWSKPCETRRADFCRRIFALDVRYEPEANWRKLNYSEESWTKLKETTENWKCRFLLPYLCSGKKWLKKRTKNRQMSFEIAHFPPYLCSVESKLRFAMQRIDLQPSGCTSIRYTYVLPCSVVTFVGRRGKARCSLTYYFKLSVVESIMLAELFAMRDNTQRWSSYWNVTNTPILHN